jgi:hypothetical protein
MTPLGGVEAIIERTLRPLAEGQADCLLPSGEHDGVRPAQPQRSSFKASRPAPFSHYLLR